MNEALRERLEADVVRATLRHDERSKFYLDPSTPADDPSYYELQDAKRAYDVATIRLAQYEQLYAAYVRADLEWAAVIRDADARKPGLMGTGESARKYRLQKQARNALLAEFPDAL